MTYKCINSGCLSSGSYDAGPPEYRSSNPFTCLRCYEDFDLDDDMFVEDEDGYVCEKCRYRCERCGDPCGDWDSAESRLVNGDRVCVDCIGCVTEEED